MRAEIVDFDQLTDSREMLEAREPNFMVVFIYLVLFLIVVAFIWMWFGEIDITVKASGILRPAKKVSVVWNINGGRIEEINYVEGKRVKKGDLLYVIDSGIYKLQWDILKKDREKLMNDIDSLKLLEKSYLEGRNLLTEDNREYYNRYLVYKYNYEQLALDLRKAESIYRREQRLSPSSTTKIRLEELEANYRLAQLAFERFKNEVLINIKNELESKEAMLKELEAQIAEIEKRIELNYVRAPIDGIVQVLQDFNVDDYMPAGIEVLRIIPEDNEQFKVEILVENKDISQLEVGQKIKYRFLALPYQEYGTVEGEIIQISEDVIIGQNETNLAYRVEGSINDTKIFDKNGRPAEIKAGMLCEVRVVVRQKKIFYYVLEKLDFIS